MKRALGWIGVILLMWVLYPITMTADAVELATAKWRNRKARK